MSDEKKKKKKPLAIAYCVSMEHFSVLMNGSTTSFCGSFEDLDMSIAAVAITLILSTRKLFYYFYFLTLIFLVFFIQWQKLKIIFLTFNHNL